ncbi:MAG: SET domain-containing protein [Chloroflexi bacterium]|nr:SET domain-containing protein [Chloroflexota bacterium]
MAGKFYSHLSPKLKSDSHADKGGCGVFAVEPVKKGELLVMWGGRIITEDEVDPAMPDFTQRVLQIEEGLFLFSMDMESADCFNHSCDPNAGFTGQIGLVAMRDIEAGEEICFDYAMCDGTHYDEFDCSCGHPHCRGRVTGDDWARPDLWERYAGYFMPYLQRRIDRLTREVNQKHKLAMA